MKSVMVVGNSNEMTLIFSKLLMANVDMRLHAKDIFNAIKTIYGRNIDAMIISSKALAATKLNFLGFLGERFSGIRIMVAFDNGLEDLHSLPEGTEIVMPKDFDSLILKLR